MAGRHRAPRSSWNQRIAPLSRPAANLRAVRSSGGRLAGSRVRPAIAAGSATVAMIALCAGTARGGPATVAAADAPASMIATLDAPVPLRLGDGRASRNAGRTDLTLEADAVAAASRQADADQVVRDRAKAKTAAAAAAVAIVPARPRGGSPAQNRELGRVLTLEYGWDAGQFSCVDEIFSQESGWSVTADNPSSSAYGIPQALPGSKMASAGSDWETNPETQIRWGLGYIDERYGTPCAAWNFKQGTGWY